MGLVTNVQPVDAAVCLDQAADRVGRLTVLLT
jgi:hypothetical protein